MESGVTEENISINVENRYVANADSAEDFQKFIHELFERNGILNDLRAYLRGHIVNVLKSAQTGDPPACQKHFTQRLDLTFQALNILIAEYLLRMDFSYTLSVFISEMPLANMVFGFAKTLMQNHSDDYSGIKFNDTDIWSILNYLGVKCDSTHASSIVHMYKNEDYLPLLLCILKCVPLYKKEPVVEHVNSSNESLSSSIKSSDTLEEKDKHPHRNTNHDKCKHYVVCKTCQNRVLRIKDKYRRKKKCLAKLFEQLKSVYEAEAAMVKQEEDKKIKRSLASHALQLKKQRDKMEESFKAREAELERGVQQKKRFLWGLAKALRDQHQHLSKAMKEVRDETGRLSEKEVNLKVELEKAEVVLKQRGEDMRSQISSELIILEGHLEDMKKERDSINKERMELESLKTCPSNASQESINPTDLRNHYDLLKNEIVVLKRYLDSTKLEPKCLVERSTMTEFDSPSNIVLNNGKDDKSCRSDDKVKASQVVNDLKKQKNVNFSPANLDELFSSRSRERSRSSASSSAGDAEPERAERRARRGRLEAENERLKTFARQQRTHIDELSSQQARLAAELAGARLRDTVPVWRPRTAPTVMPQSNFLLQRINASASVNALGCGCGWRKGAGEELGLLGARPAARPGDAVPFIGVLRDRHDSRRHLINQWRALRRRVSPLRVVTRPPSALAAPTTPTMTTTTTTTRIDRNLTASAATPGSAGPSASLPEKRVTSSPEQAKELQTIREKSQRPKASVATECSKNREKSPKSVLKEAKEKLKNKEIRKDHPPLPTEKSPNAVLREAKLRLRKLEIEAEAVEKSYLDFRRRQIELREERQTNSTRDGIVVGQEHHKELDMVRNRSLQKIDEAYRMDMEERYHDARKTFKNDLDAYLLEYPPKINLGETHFKNRNTAAEREKPIPVVFKNMEQENEQARERRNNYLEAPLTEFRKLYNSEKRHDYVMPSRSESPMQRSNENTDAGTSSDICDNQRNARNSAVKRAKHNKKAELEILKNNIGKIYNLQNQSEIETKIVPIAENITKNETAIPLETLEHSKNLLRVEVESVSEVNDIHMTESQTQDLVLVVRSSEIKESDITETTIEGEKIAPQMTIIISPKKVPQNITSNLTKRNETPEQAAGLTREDVLDAIFNADLDDHNSSEHLEIPPAADIHEDSIIEEEHAGDDYLDDFSADVDNYNSRSEYGNHSPISLPKTSEDENFWDS